MITRCAVTIGVAASLLSACATNTDKQQTMALPPPACMNAQVLLKVHFLRNPIEVTGGVSVPGQPNDKLVHAGQTICWIAVDESNNPVETNFAIVFSPADHPNPNQPWEMLQVWPKAPIGLEYKYTVWREGLGSYLDPRIEIN